MSLEIEESKDNKYWVISNGSKTKRYYKRSFTRVEALRSFNAFSVRL